MTSLRLSPDLENRLEHLAALTQRSKSFFIKKALERHLKDLEDIFIALQRILQPNRQFHTSKEVLKNIAANAKMKKANAKRKQKK